MNDKGKAAVRDAGEELGFALAKHPEHVQVARLSDLGAESARRKPTRPAYVRFNVPDNVARAITGSPGKAKFVAYLVLIRKEALDRKDSRIILPGER